MKVLKKISLSEIIECLEKNSINIKEINSKDISFLSLNSLINASNEDLTFFSNSKYLEQLKKTKAKGCIIKKEFIDYLPKNCLPLIVESPYQVLGYISDIFDINNSKSDGVISQNTKIHNESILKNNIQIDSFTVLKKNTIVMNNVIIGSNCTIGPNVVIQDDCIIEDNTSLSNCIIENNCIIMSGARIGGTGFGFDEKSKKNIIHFGNVVIEKYSHIGSNTTIDRAVFDSTIIGSYSHIDNLVQIAHNVKIGKHAIIAAQVGIAGSTNIGDYVKIGGQCGISGHLKIGNNVTIAGKSGVTKNISDNKIIAGFPAKDINKWKKEIIKLQKI